MKQITLLFIISFLLLNTCKQEDSSAGPDDTSKNLPAVSTAEPTAITTSSAKSGGNITNDGGVPVTSRGVCWGTAQNPVVGGNKTNEGTGSGSFASTLTGLNAGTKYFIRAYATNGNGTAYGNELQFTTAEESDGTLTYNGVTYKTVSIGTQEWTVENLKTSTYNDGTPITKVTDPSAWNEIKTGAFCAYNNNESTAATNGYLYNWFAVFTGKLAPATGGWRIPTDADWTKLTDFLGSNAGTKLKAKSGWTAPGNGTDDFGFSALPGGYCDGNGSFSYLGYAGYWWSSTSFDSNTDWCRFMNSDDASVYRSTFNKKYGFSIRLVRDK